MPDCHIFKGEKEKIPPECKSVIIRVNHNIKKDKTKDVEEIACYNAQKLCERSHYFETYVRNVSKHLVKAEKIEDCIKNLGTELLFVNFGEEVNSNALRWIVEWIHDTQDSCWAHIESLEGDDLFDYLVTANFLQIDTLEVELSRRLVKTVDENNFVIAWYKAQAYSLTPLAEFIQKAFIDCGDRKRIIRYGSYDFKFKFGDLSLKCHKSVYNLALNEKALESQSLVNDLDQHEIDITPEALKLYAECKTGIKLENAIKMEDNIKIEDDIKMKDDIKMEDDIKHKIDKVSLSENQLIKPDSNGYLMEGLYHVVNWLYTKELAMEYDSEAILAMIQIARCIHINEKFIPFLFKVYEKHDVNVMKLYFKAIEEQIPEDYLSYRFELIDHSQLII